VLAGARGMWAGPLVLCPFLTHEEKEVICRKLPADALTCSKLLHATDAGAETWGSTKQCFREQHEGTGAPGGGAVRTSVSVCMRDHQNQP